MEIELKKDNEPVIINQVEALFNNNLKDKKEMVVFFDALVKTEMFQKYLKTTNTQIIKKESKPNPHHTVCKNIFMSFVKDEKHFDYYWTPKDAKNLNLLISKFKFILEDKFNEKTLLVLFKRLLKGIKEYDPWMFDRLDIALINSQFNNIVSKLQAQVKKVKVRAIDGGKVLLIDEKEYLQKKNYYRLVD